MTNFNSLSAAFLEHEHGPSGTRRSSTLLLRERILTKYLRPEFGSMAPGDISVFQLRDYIDTLNHQGLSGSHVRGIITTCSVVMDYGCRRGALLHNPCRDLVRGDLPSGRRQTEPRYLTPGEVERLLAKVGTVYGPVASCCYYAALRISEALALTWADVDFHSRRITIREGKTRASQADVPLLPPLEKVLRPLWEKRGRPSDGSLVFQSRTGKPLGRRNALRAIHRAGDAVGLNPVGVEKVGLHDLRHSMAAYALERCTPVETSKLLRHANPQVTMTVYAGMSGDIVETLMSKLGGPQVSPLGVTRGRIAQRESARFTRERSLVRSQVRP
jgi:integrase